MKFAFIEEEKARHSVMLLCRVLEVSRSGFYAWLGRGESRWLRRERQLATKIRVLHAESLGRYGSPRVHRDLLAQGEHVSRKRVARLMREQNLFGRRRRRCKRTTNSDSKQAAASNVLARRFDVATPNRFWAADISYIRTWEGWLFIAVVLDLFSRRVVGWAMEDHMRVELPLVALRMAVAHRRLERGLIIHSDRGSQYASELYRNELEAHGMVQSMSRKGNCWDNAVVESFFSTLKEELIYRASWPTKAATKDAVADYIELFYNARRRHSALGYLSPIQYERMSKVQRFAA